MSADRTFAEATPERYPANSRGYGAAYPRAVPPGHPRARRTGRWARRALLAQAIARGPADTGAGGPP